MFLFVNALEFVLNAFIKGFFFLSYATKLRTVITPMKWRNSITLIIH